MSNGKTRSTNQPYQIHAAGMTDIGCVRKRNEDAFLADMKNGLFVVSDGLGGHPGGDVASRLIVELFPQILERRLRSSVNSRGDCVVMRKILAESLSEMSQSICRSGRNSPANIGMGATAVVAWIIGQYAHIAHMGDSRAYILRGSRFRQLTRDHSLVSLLLQHGEITTSEAVSHPARGRLTRFVGMEAEVMPDTQSVKLHVGDRLLLCSDGLWGMFPIAKMKTILMQSKSPVGACRDLVEAGKVAGGSDNLTAIVIDVVKRMPS